MQAALNKKFDLRLVAAFFIGALICICMFEYIEIRKQPAGVLAFDSSSTTPGSLKVLYTKDGVLIDPGWVVAFQPGNLSNFNSFPLPAGRYGLVGFKPLIENGGTVSIKNLKIISKFGTRDLNNSGFIGINQLASVESKNGEISFGPSFDASDPFGVFPNLAEQVARVDVSLTSLIWSIAGKLALLAVFVGLIFGASGSLPFVSDLKERRKEEPAPAKYFSLVVAGVIILYLRNAHSLSTPILYTEDGEWLAGLLDRGFFDMLFNAKGGHARYFVFGNVLLLEAALLTNKLFFGLNLTFLPHFVSLYSVLFYSALAAVSAFLLKSTLRIEARVILWLCILLVPMGDSSFEILGRLSNVGFAFFFLAFCLLVSRYYSPENPNLRHIAALDFGLFICANTNPLCYPMIAATFLLAAWKDWQQFPGRRAVGWAKGYIRKPKVQSGAVLLTVLFGFGLWMLFREKGGDSFLSGSINPKSIIELSLARTLLFPIIFPLYGFLDNFKTILFSAIFMTSVTILVIRSNEEKNISLACLSLLIAATVASIWSRPGLTLLLDNYKTTVLDRYYFGFSFLSTCLIACALSAGFRLTAGRHNNLLSNTLAGFFLAIYASNASYLFEFTNPRWDNLPRKNLKESIFEAYSKVPEPAKEGNRYQVAIHPAPWVTHFPQENVLATVLGLREPPISPSNATIASPKEVLKPRGQFDGKIIRQKPANRGREDGWFYVSDGRRSWIPNGDWLKQKNLTPADVIEVRSDEFSEIPDTGEPVK